MRRGAVRIAVVAAVLVNSIVAAGSAGNAGTDEYNYWGVVSYPLVAHPGSVVLGLGPISSLGYDNNSTSGGAAGTATPIIPTTSSTAPLRGPRQSPQAAEEECVAGPLYANVVIDRSGRTWSTPQAKSRFNVILAGGAATAPHWLRVSCSQSVFRPAFVVVCKQFVVDPALPQARNPRDARIAIGPNEPPGSGRALVSDPCPREGVGRILATHIAVTTLITVGTAFEAAGAPFVGLAGLPPLPTTSTTRRVGGGAITTTTTSATAPDPETPPTEPTTTTTCPITISCGP